MDSRKAKSRATNNSIQYVLDVGLHKHQSLALQRAFLIHILRIKLLIVDIIGKRVIFAIFKISYFVPPRPRSSQI